MRPFEMELMEHAREETVPPIPGRIRWKARIFGKRIILEYLWKYYQGESGSRIPLYLPYIYIKQCFDYLCRYAEIPRKQIHAVLIDGGGAAIEDFLYEFLEILNDMIIVTERPAYFSGLQERVFEELGLPVELAYPWEEQKIQGNLVWDFSEKIQSPCCYPEGSICFLPHKTEWRVRELLTNSHKLTVVTIAHVQSGRHCISPSLAESLLIPANFPFRRSRCEELKSWCRQHQWKISLKPRNS